MKTAVLTAFAFAACAAANPSWGPNTQLQCICQPIEPAPGASEIPVHTEPASPAPSAPSNNPAPPASNTAPPAAPSKPADEESSPSAPATQPPASVPTSISVSVPTDIPIHPAPTPSPEPSPSTGAPGNPGNPSNPGGENPGDNETPGKPGDNDDDDDEHEHPGDNEENPGNPGGNPGDEEEHEGGCDDDGCHGTGHIIQDEAPQINKLLTVIGEHAEELSIRLSPSAEKLVSSLGLPGGPVGSIVKSGSSIGELLQDLGNPTELLLSTTGKDTGNSLIKLGPAVTDLLKELGHDSIAEPVGNIVGKTGSHLKKRDEGLLEDIAPIVRCILEIAGDDTSMSLVELSEPAASLVAALAGKDAGDATGETIKTVATVGDLLREIAPIVECILIILGEDGSMTLVDLSPELAGLLKGLGLPDVGSAVGDIVNTIGEGF